MQANHFTIPKAGLLTETIICLKFRSILFTWCTTYYRTWPGKYYKTCIGSVSIYVSYKFAFCYNLSFFIYPHSSSAVNLLVYHCLSFALLREVYKNLINGTQLSFYFKSTLTLLVNGVNTSPISIARRFYQPNFKSTFFFSLFPTRQLHLLFTCFSLFKLIFSLPPQYFYL